MSRVQVESGDGPALSAIIHGHHAEVSDKLPPKAIAAKSFVIGAATAGDERDPRVHGRQTFAYLPPLAESGALGRRVGAGRSRPGPGTVPEGRDPVTELDRGVLASQAARDAKRVGHDVVVAQLDERRRGPQHPFERAGAAGPEQRGEIKVPRV